MSTLTSWHRVCSSCVCCCWCLFSFCYFERRLSPSTSSYRTCVLLLLRLWEHPSSGEGHVGDTIRHHRVFHLRPRTCHLWPRPALRHPSALMLPRLDEPCNKDREGYINCNVQKPEFSATFLTLTHRLCCKRQPLTPSFLKWRYLIFNNRIYFNF